MNHEEEQMWRQIYGRPYKRRTLEDIEKEQLEIMEGVEKMKQENGYARLEALKEQKKQSRRALNQLTKDWLVALGVIVGLAACFVLGI